MDNKNINQLKDIISFVEDKNKNLENLKVVLNLGVAYACLQNPVFVAILPNTYTLSGISNINIFDNVKNIFEKKSKEEKAVENYNKCKIAEIILAKLAIKTSFIDELNGKKKFFSNWKIKKSEEKYINDILNKEKKLNDDLLNDLDKLNKGFPLNFIEKTIDNLFDILEIQNMTHERNQLIKKITEKYIAFKNQLKLESKTFEIYSHDFYNQEKNEYSDLYLTLYEFEKNLINNTQPSISLNFFDYEDDQFYKNLEKKINNTNVIYLNSRSREEAIYYTLFLLKNKFQNKIKDVYIVETIDNWRKLSKKVEGKILIANFNSLEIQTIANNTCIFSYGHEEFTNKKNDLIPLKNRVLTNINDKLQKEVSDIDEVRKIMNKTNGLFVSIKRHVFKGKMGTPQWASQKDSLKSLVPALLIGEWCDKDKDILERLSGKNYDDYLLDIAHYINKEDPFLLKNESQGKYKIANLDEAWDILKSYITPKHLDVYKEMMKEIFNEIPEIFKEPIDEHYKASILNKESSYSFELKKGMSNTLIFMSDTTSEYVEEILKDIFSEINTREAWFAISSYFPSFMEASPKAILEVLNKEVEDENSDFWFIFKEQSSSSSFGGRNYYVNILWALELLLCYEDYAIDSLKLLAKLSEKDFQYSLMNKPINTLSHSLSAWLHDVNISVETKIEMSNYILDTFDIKEKLLINILPDKSPSQSFTEMSKPKFKQYELKYSNITRKDLYDTYKKYTEFSIKYAENDLSIWNIIFDKLTFFDFNLENKVFNGVIHALENNFSDIDKFKFSQIIRDLIYKNRYFEDAIWALKEEYISQIEKMIFNKIKFTNKLYKYIPFFTIYEPQILNPSKFKNDSFNYGENYQRIYNIRSKKLKEIIIKDDDLSDFYQLLSLLKNNNCEFSVKRQIGEIIATEFHKNNIKIGFCKKIIKLNEEELLISYLSQVGKNDFNAIKNAFNDLNLNDSFKAKLLSNFELDNSILEFLELNNEIVKKLYWKEFNYWNPKIESLNETIWENLLKYSNFRQAFWVLKQQQYFDLNKGIELLDEMVNSNPKENPQYLSSENLKYIFKEIYKFENLDLKERILQLEIYYFNALSEYPNKFKIKYLLKDIENNPEILTDLIKFSFKSEEQEKVILSDQEQNIAKNSYNILHKLKFCPGDSEELTSDEKLKDWVDKYIKLIKQNKQHKIGIQYLGTWFSHSPIDKDGIFPLESIRKIFEQHEDKHLKIGFCVGVENQRGVYTDTNGVGESKLADKYSQYSQKTKIKYPQVSKALKEISDNYKSLAIRERESATYGF